jgi:aminopeptidase YwaD
MSSQKQRAFSFLEKIFFVREAGTSAELKAAGILLDEIRDIGFKGSLESFLILQNDVKKVEFEILEPYTASYKVAAYGLAENTPPGGLSADFAYVQDANDMDLLNAKGKIVLLNPLISTNIYRKLLDAGVAGFISISGSVLDKPDETDIDKNFLNDDQLQMGNIPGITMRVKDAMEIVRKKASKVRITLDQKRIEVDSNNVVAEIEGTEYPDEVVAFVAHYDTIPYSPGAYDNGAGSVIIMEMLRHFAENPPKRTLRFIWFGAEERGLLGSKAYVERHKSNLKELKLVINVDMAGTILGAEQAIVTADISLVHMINYLSNEIGHSITVTHDIYSSDSTPFSYKGIPSVSFARYGTRGSAPGHNRFDLLDHLCADHLSNTLVLLKPFCERLVGACVFPVPSEIPENIKKAVDIYMTKGKDGRKQMDKVLTEKG